MTDTAAALPDRSALYYPRIHFRDLEWLKGTLLAFGRVHRIVPDEHPLDRDSDAVRVISARHGAEKPLVFEISPEMMFVENAQRQLYELLHASDPGELDRRFGVAAAAAREREVGTYELAKSKIHFAMLDMLESRGLVWRPPETGHAFSRIPSRVEWLRIHPDLGEAIMGVSAIGAARAVGCDVVTDAAALHTAIASLDVSALLQHVAKGYDDATLSADRATDHLAHAVLTTHFDLRQLSMDRIRGMIADGADLRAFRKHLHAFAMRIPEEVSPAERARRLEELATEVVASWKEMQARLPVEAKAAMKSAAKDGTKQLVEDAAKQIVSAGVLGTAALVIGGLTAPAIVAAVLATVGVPIGFALVKTAWAARRPDDGPTRYLSRLSAQGGVLLSTPRPCDP